MSNGAGLATQSAEVEEANLVNPPIVMSVESSGDHLGRLLQ